MRDWTSPHSQYRSDITNKIYLLLLNQYKVPMLIILLIFIMLSHPKREYTSIYQQIKPILYIRISSYIFDVLKILFLYFLYFWMFLQVCLLLHYFWICYIIKWLLLRGAALNYWKKKKKLFYYISYAIVVMWL